MAGMWAIPSPLSNFRSEADLTSRPTDPDEADEALTSIPAGAGNHPFPSAAKTDCPWAVGSCEPTDKDAAAARSATGRRVPFFKSPCFVAISRGGTLTLTLRGYRP